MPYAWHYIFLMKFENEYPFDAYLHNNIIVFFLNANYFESITF